MGELPHLYSAGCVGYGVVWDDLAGVRGVGQGGATAAWDCADVGSGVAACGVFAGEAGACGAAASGGGCRVCEQSSELLRHAVAVCQADVSVSYSGEGSTVEDTVYWVVSGAVGTGAD